MFGQSRKIIFVLNSASFKIADFVGFSNSFFGFFVNSFDKFIGSDPLSWELQKENKNSKDFVESFAKIFWGEIFNKKFFPNFFHHYRQTSWQKNFFVWISDFYGVIFLSSSEKWSVGEQNNWWILLEDNFVLSTFISGWLN